VPRDFTLKAYGGFLSALEAAGYAACTVREGLSEINAGVGRRLVILRHDVDLRPDRSLAMAALEEGAGVRSTYYFRVVPASYDEAVMRAVEAMGHEVGYHYEDLALAGGDLERARASFLDNLAKMRGVVRVDTACMHGSPMSRHDNRRIFEVLSLEEAGLAGEPYLSLGGTGLAYLTDTGRCWNAGGANLRDRLEGSPPSPYARTSDIVKALAGGVFPAIALVTTHPQRWTDSLGGWMWEWAFQSVKNAVKAVR
jgi:hypothetical protein